MQVTPAGDPNNNNFWTGSAPNLITDSYWKEEV
jgi:hypothetical protein